MKRYLASVLARNALWMITGQGLRLVIQAAYFTVIARSLGASNYGAFIGVAALVGIVFPFGTLGSGNLLIKNVARDKTLFATCWGQALLITLSCTSLLFAAGAGLSGRELEENHSDHAFLQAWCRLEAFTKAQGKGLGGTEYKEW